MRTARAALALLLSFAIPARAETTTDPLWYLLSTFVLAPDARAVSAEGEGPADAKGLAALQSDLLLLSDGFESFRDEAQVKETLTRLQPRMSPELKPFFQDRASSLDAIYRTLAVTDYTWAQRFPEPPCAPTEARRKLLDSRDGLFQTEKGEASPWLASLLGPRAEGKSADHALDQASFQTRLTGAEYEKLRARVRKLTLALASDKAVGAARARLYCSRAAAFAGLAAFHRVKDAGLISAARAVVQKPEESVFVVAWKDKRAAATLVRTKSGVKLVTDAAVVADTDHPDLFAFSKKAKPLALTATVIRRHPQLSVAVLAYAEDMPRPALALADIGPSKDDLVTAVGHTSVSGLWTKTSGLVTKVGDISFQTDAAVSPELSGGPVLNEAGEVAGMLVLRPADTEEGRWPVAIPAPVLARWLDDPGAAISGAPATEAVEDAGTAAILSRARPSALTEAGLGVWEIPKLPPPPPTPPGVCVSGCGGSSSPSSSYSGGSSNDAAGAELGQALGKLGAVLVLQGIPALFRGIGKLFKGKGGSVKTTAHAETRAVTDSIPKIVEPPPKPRCKLKSLPAPETVGAEPFELSVQFSCDDTTVPLDGHRVTFAFEWDGKKSTQTVTLVTDARGLATLGVQVSNEATAVQRVRTISEKNHQELDDYDPHKKDPDEPADFREAGQAEAPEPVTVEKALMTAVATTGTAGAAGRAVGIFALVGRGAALRVTATIALGPVATAAVVLVAAKQVFDIGWAIGSVAERKISDIQRGLRQYDREDDCALKPGEEVLNRFIDGTRLSAGYLQAHEGEEIGLGHTVTRHVKKRLDYLAQRLAADDSVTEASSFDDISQAESVIRTAIMSDIARITLWSSTKNAATHSSKYLGDSSRPIGYGIALADVQTKARLKFNAIIRLRQKPDCKIFILTAFPN